MFPTCISFHDDDKELVIDGDTDKPANINLQLASLSAAVSITSPWTATNESSSGRRTVGKRGRSMMKSATNPSAKQNDE